MAEREEANPAIETGIVIEIGGESGTGTGTGTQIVRGTEIGMVEAVVTEEEGWTGDPEMEEMEAGIGTVTVAVHSPQLGMETEGHLEVQFTHIRKSVDKMSEL